MIFRHTNLERKKITHNRANYIHTLAFLGYAAFSISLNVEQQHVTALSNIIFIQKTS
jgi:hypothetical protein